jgi:methylmalonyl-CoA/ethylmalonyl-CoA epimerase
LRYPGYSGGGLKNLSNVSQIHHLNFLVRDLAAARRQYTARLGLEFGADEVLKPRGVVTCRAKLGATWIVLVQPLDPHNEIGRRLERQGEGVFLVSFAVDDLDAERAAHPELGPARHGLENWRVADFPNDAQQTTVIQLCATSPTNRSV